jgi:quercetin dioxygenase-like cupin family protein
MANQQVRSLDAPNQVVNMEYGKIDIVHIAGGGVGRATFQPGWKWSEHEKPVVEGGEYCEAAHFVYLVAGQLHVVMADGSAFDLKAGDVATIPAGHDGWVVGDKPVTMFDFGGVAQPF